MSETPRDRLATFLRDDLERAAREQVPLDEAQLEAYVDGTLDEVEREIVESRLADDAGLRAEVDDLRALRAVLTPPGAAAAMPASATPRATMPDAADTDLARFVAFEPRPPASTLPATRRGRTAGWFGAIGIAAALLLAFVVWRRDGARQLPREDRATQASPPSPSSPPSPAASASADAGAGQRAAADAAADTIRDGGSTIALAADGTLRGLDAVPPERRAVIATALKGGTLPAWPRAADVAGRGGLLMSADAAGSGFVPIGPRATAVAGATPTFRWTALAGATGYRVRVVDDALTTVAESPLVTALSWRPRSPLPRSRVLLWQVEAETPQGPRTTPAPPLPDARFVVLTPADEARVREAIAATGGSDLAAAVIAAEAGLHDEAAAALGRLTAANPSSDRIRALSADLERRRRGRRPGADSR